MPTRGDDPTKDAARRENAGRVRAARAYAGIDQAAVAERLGVSVITVKRMERGMRDISLDELQKIADLCGMPRPLLEHGFASFAENAAEATAKAMMERMHEVVHDELHNGMTRLAEVLLAREDAQAVSRDALRSLQAPAQANNA